MSLFTATLRELAMGPSETTSSTGASNAKPYIKEGCLTVRCRLSRPNYLAGETVHGLLVLTSSGEHCMRVLLWVSLVVIEEDHPCM